MIKKVYVGSTQGLYKQRYYNHKLASHIKYIAIKLVCPITYAKSKTLLVLILY